MALRKKKPDQIQSPNAETLRDRAAKFSEEELMNGMEQLLSNMCRQSEDYHRWRAIEILGEFNLSIESMHVLITELMNRKGNPLGKLGTYKIKDPKEARQLRPF